MKYLRLLYVTPSPGSFLSSRTCARSAIRRTVFAIWGRCNKCDGLSCRARPNPVTVVCCAVVSMSCRNEVNLEVEVGCRDPRCFRILDALWSLEQRLATPSAPSRRILARRAPKVHFHTADAAFRILEAAAPDHGLSPPVDVSATNPATWPFNGPVERKRPDTCRSRQVHPRRMFKGFKINATQASFRSQDRSMRCQRNGA